MKVRIKTHQRVMIPTLLKEVYEIEANSLEDAIRILKENEDNTLTDIKEVEYVDTISREPIDELEGYSEPFISDILIYDENDNLIEL